MKKLKRILLFFTLFLIAVNNSLPQEPINRYESQISTFLNKLFEIELDNIITELDEYDEVNSDLLISYFNTESYLKDWFINEIKKMKSENFKYVSQDIGEMGGEYDFIVFADYYKHSRIRETRISFVFFIKSDTIFFNGFDQPIK